MMKIFKYLDGGEMLGGELELIKKAPPGIKEILYDLHDKVYNDFYAKNPNRVALRNKAKAYGQAAPTPLNIIKQIYNYIGSDPTYGLRAKIALDNRAFDRLPTKGKINTFWDALIPSRPFYNIYKSTQKFLNGGKNHWKFSERNVGNLGNGYSVTNHWIYQDLVNGLRQGDFPPTAAGRTIYTSPYRSDTLYWRNLDPRQDFLFEQVPTKSKDLKGAKLNFYKWVNRSEPESSTSNGAYQRAKRGFQSGGELPTAPRAEVRYANSQFIPDSKYAWHLTQEVRQIVPHNVMGGGMLPASIRRYIPSDGDTTYVELPEAQSSLFRPTVRYERKASFKNQKGQEYNILKRRFNTAVQMATQK